MHTLQKSGAHRRAVACTAVMALAVVGGSIAPGISDHALARRTSAQLVQGFSNSAAIAVPEANQATPSSIFVSGFDTPIADVDVTLDGLTHSVVNDLDILLLGPQGQSALLVSDVGSSANNVTLALDDQAPEQINSAGPMTSGTFQPTNFQTPDSFTPPAPASPKGTRLAIFNSTDANGEWRLIVRDDTLSNAGTIAGGWSMRITSANGVPNAQPDSNTVRAGKTVTNLGGVLDNDDDPDDDPLTAVLAGEPAKGTVSLQPDGSYTYRAKKRSKGTDSFTYLARDPGGLSDLETVTIKITKKKKKRK
ncbi:MAG: Ig-like domain-containing protein [Chloroflexota bacterium]|nr:Ig-like domain-containing protein [Chloroflexota bacterium]